MLDGKGIYTRPTPQSVVDVMQALTVVGMGTPSIAREKCRMLFQNASSKQKVAVVVIDVIRCTSTILACFASGVKSVTVTVKGEAEKGTTIEQSKELSMLLGRDLVLGGELKGLPIPGGIIGNSPSEAASCPLLFDKHLHFESSNFGKTFSEITQIVHSYNNSGGDATILVSSYANAKTVATFIKNEGFTKIYLMCGGFYDGITLEDEIASGAIISELNVDLVEMDDEARMMLILYDNFKDFNKQYELLSTNSVSKLLSAFNKHADIETVLNGKGISEHAWISMQKITPFVSWINNIPVIVS